MQAALAATRRTPRLAECEICERLSGERDAALCGWQRAVAMGERPMLRARAYMTSESTMDGPMREAARAFVVG